MIPDQLTNFYPDIIDNRKSVIPVVTIQNIYNFRDVHLLINEKH